VINNGDYPAAADAEEFYESLTGRRGRSITLSIRGTHV